MGAPRKEETLALFAGLAGGYERYASLLSFGQDPRWRRYLVSSLPVGPDDHVLDVACGTGAVAAELVRQHRCRVTGIDQSPAMLQAARHRLTEVGLAGRVELVQGEAERLPYSDASFDGLSVTYLLRYVDDPAATLRELVRVLRPGSTLASLEFGVPPGRLPRAAWRAYTAVGLPLAGRLVSPAWSRAGRFLDHSIPSFYARHPLSELLSLYRDAGLVDVSLRRLSFGAGVVIWGRRAHLPHSHAPTGEGRAGARPPARPRRPAAA